MVERPRDLAVSTSSAFASAMELNEASSSSLEAKLLKKELSMRRVTPPISEKARTAASTADSAFSHSPAGMWSRAPVSWTTTSRSPSAKASASSAGTRVTRLPPKMIGIPTSSLVSGSIMRLRLGEHDQVVSVDDLSPGHRGVLASHTAHFTRRH